MALAHKRIGGGLLAASLALLTACGGGASGSGSGSGGGFGDEITIGVALPTTGGSAVLGTPMTNGIEMAVKKINDDGGIGGAKLKINQVDLGATDSDALNAFNRVTGDKPAAVIGFPVSTQGFAVATQVDRAGLPVVMGGTNPGLTDASDWIFSMTSSDKLTSTAAAQFAAEKLGIKKVGLLRESGELGTGASKVLHTAADKFGFKIVDEEIFTTGDVDLSTQANKLRNSGAQMLFVYGQQADYIVVSNALATAGVKLPTFIAGLQPGTYQQLNKDGFATIYNRNQCIPSAATEGALADWTKEYKAAYTDAPTEYSAIAYDGMNLLAKAIKKAGSTDPKAIADALHKLPEADGVCGKHGGTDSGALSFGVTIGHYENGTYVPDQQLTVKP
jgi:branched-chain amino acid transport system substrate-binding protein